MKHKESKLIHSVVVELGGFNIRLEVSGKCHYKIYFNWRLNDVLMELARPVVLASTPRQRENRKAIERAVKRQQLYHSRPAR